MSESFVTSHWTNGSTRGEYFKMNSFFIREQLEFSGSTERSENELYSFYTEFYGVLEILKCTFLDQNQTK